MMTPDQAFTWTTGAGIGLAVTVVTWTTFNRLASLWLPAPEGPISALSIAVLAGTVVAFERGRVLSRQSDDNTERGQAEPDI